MTDEPPDDDLLTFAIISLAAVGAYLVGHAINRQVDKQEPKEEATLER